MPYQTFRHQCSGTSVNSQDDHVNVMGETSRSQCERRGGGWDEINDAEGNKHGYWVQSGHISELSSAGSGQDCQARQDGQDEAQGWCFRNFIFFDIVTPSIVTQVMP